MPPRNETSPHVYHCDPASTNVSQKPEAAQNNPATRGSMYLIEQPRQGEQEQRSGGGREVGNGTGVEGEQKLLPEEEWPREVWAQPMYNPMNYN
jgi:hypothetical protein